MQFTNTQIHTDEIPDSRDINFEFLDIKFRKSQLISVVLFYTGAMIMMVVSLLLFKEVEIPPSWIILVVAIWLVLFTISIIYVIKSYHYEGYALREKDIMYKSGIFFKSVTIIPFNRVQHCEIQQGPTERYFNLGSLLLYTAGGSSSDLIIKGLIYSKAQILKEFITKNVSEE